MPEHPKKIAVSKFPLRLMPSVRRIAENFSLKEGVSLNQFINVAVAEKLAHLQHEEWLADRPKATETLRNKALQLLGQNATRRPEKSDQIPAGYVKRRRKRKTVAASAK